MNHQPLGWGFLASAERMPDRPALHVDGVLWSYGTLRQIATALAATLQERCGPDAGPFVAVFADRSQTGFTGILGSLLAGHGYVPLNPQYPIARTRGMLDSARCRVLIADARAEAQLDLLLSGLDDRMLVILPDTDDARPWADRWPNHEFLAARDLSSPDRWLEPSPDAGGLAYLLFTSGSTGAQKGVAVTHANVSHVLRAMVERYQIGCDDRLSQMFDATFDLSVFDMFGAWNQGACVYCPPRAQLLNPDRYIREHELTIWFSVPTAALLMKRFGSLQPGRYPSLRWSLFCGEPLPLELADAWAAAAPRSAIENLYGPTELTVACTAYRWHPQRAREESAAGLVPIGVPHPGMRARIVNESLEDVAPGEVGELLMAGPQCVPGYWRDEEATAEAFVRLRGEDEIYYRSGDHVRRAAAGGPLQFVGRTDHQVKLAGHRIELGEVEAILRQEPGVHEAAAIGWPRNGAAVTGITAFLGGTNIDVFSVRARVRSKLQSYAVPQTILVLPALPQNANGKVDRQALVKLLEA